MSPDTFQSVCFIFSPLRQFCFSCVLWSKFLFLQVTEAFQEMHATPSHSSPTFWTHRRASGP